MYYESKMKSIILKILIFHAFKASRSTFFSFTPMITEVIERSNDLSTTFREINVRGKSIFRDFRNNIANSSVRNDI